MIKIEKKMNLIEIAEGARQMMLDYSDHNLMFESNLDEAERWANEAWRLGTALERIKDHAAYRQDWMLLREKIAWFEASAEEISSPVREAIGYGL